MSVLGPAHEYAEEFAIMRGEGPEILDPDSDSKREREINRLWVTMRRLGENHVYAADDLIRRQMFAKDPTLRAEALHVLIGMWGREELLGYAINIAVERHENPMVRVAAIEAIGALDQARIASITDLLKSLAKEYDTFGVCQAATKVLAGA